MLDDINGLEKELNMNSMDTNTIISNIDAFTPSKERHDILLSPSSDDRISPEQQDSFSKESKTKNEDT